MKGGQEKLPHDPGRIPEQGLIYVLLRGAEGSWEFS